MNLEGANQDAKLYSKYTNMTELKKDFKLKSEKDANHFFSEPTKMSSHVTHQLDDNLDQTERLVTKI